MKTLCDACQKTPAAYFLDYLGVRLCGLCLTSVNKAILRQNALPEYAACENCRHLEYERWCVRLKIGVSYEGRCQHWEERKP